MSVDPRKRLQAARAAAAAAATGTVNPPPPTTTQQPAPAPVVSINSISAPQHEASMSASTTSEVFGATTDAVQPPQSEDESFKLKFCTVCASNNNRSMEAHLRLSMSDKHYPTISFGTGSCVRLPGPSISQPQVYPFNTTSYTHMHDELQAQDARLYKNNGILNMLDRNRHIKLGPERFHDWVVGKPRLDALSRGDKGSHGAEGGVVDVIFTCEERCWDAVVENLLDRGAPLNRPVHVFNVDIRDNHEEALVGGRAILELANSLNEAAEQERTLNGADGWQNGQGTARMSFDERVPDILAEWQERWPNLPALWTLSWL